MDQPKILYEDNHLIVADKPAGYLSQADGKGAPDMLTFLKSYISQKYDKPGDVFMGLVHRLDQPVSGIMVFARTSKAASRLSQQIRDHQMEKKYKAIVHGRPDPPAGEIKIRLLKDQETNLVRVDPTGKESNLVYQTVAYDLTSDSTLLAIELGTGRGHQIRVSLAHAGWPIYFDQKYGLPSDRGCGDIALIASSLRFKHPTRDEMLTFNIDLPPRPPYDRFQHMGLV
jgi:23S rRNA pseudouridine1911/1915/1917 synthase